MRKILLAALLTIITWSTHAQVWTADLGDGTYKNPVLHADYSDPDACRVGEDYYMVASSFTAVPGIPILHSKDLVNWELLGYALNRLTPLDFYITVRHGGGVWAPSIRYHKDEFWIYYPDPDFGIYLTKSKKAEGPWSEPELVEGGKGLIDPCPFWDDDNQAYLVHAYAGSRAGIKSILVLKKLNEAGTRTVDGGKIIFDGHVTDPTVEGPKLYKRNGYYYVFAPAGGVKTGWQLVLRSKNLYGPYERKVVIDQGSTVINGPHQGAWVSTPTGEDWFLHFQDKEAYGRVVLLEPMKWQKDWPVIGSDPEGDGKGEPVLRGKKPTTGKEVAILSQETDEFNNSRPGLHWQWQANPEATWSFHNTASGVLRLFARPVGANEGLWTIPNLLLQKLPAEEFIATTRITFYPNPKVKGERAGLVVFGEAFASLSLVSAEKGLALVYATGSSTTPEVKQLVAEWAAPEVFIRLTVRAGGICTFAYSLDGKSFQNMKATFQAMPGKWVGAKMGLFCISTIPTNDSGFVDVDWFRVEPITKD